MKQVPGYTLVRTEDCPEQHGTLTVLTHDVSGATILLVENEDNNKAFGIGFGTFPSDDTGVFHILEHSVLAGSEKYPVTSPFLQLLKSSMASFLNAMTFPDKTVYPFATPNETDFRNLNGKPDFCAFHRFEAHKQRGIAAVHRFPSRKACCFTGAAQPLTYCIIIYQRGKKVNDNFAKKSDKKACDPCKKASALFGGCFVLCLARIVVKHLRNGR